MLPGIDSILHFCPECGQQRGEPKARNFRGRHSWMETPYANVQLSEAGGRALTDRPTKVRSTIGHARCTFRNRSGNGPPPLAPESGTRGDTTPLAIYTK